MKNRIAATVLVALALCLTAQTQRQDDSHSIAFDNWRFSLLIYQEGELKISVDQAPDQKPDRRRLRTFIQVEQEYTFVQFSEPTAIGVAEALLDVEHMAAGGEQKIGGVRLAFVNDADDGFQVHIGGSEIFGASLILNRDEAVVVRSHLLQTRELIRCVTDQVRVGN